MLIAREFAALPNFVVDGTIKEARELLVRSGTVEIAVLELC